jgi:hypothetical protein
MLLTRDLRAIVALLVPVALVAGAMLLLGSDAYRFNLLHIHRDFTFNWRAGPIHMAAVVLVGGWFWALPAVVLAAGAAHRAWPARDEEHQRSADAAMLLGCVAGVAFLFAIFAMSKDGADRNYVFESLVPSAALAGAALINLLHQAAPRRLIVVSNVVLLLGLLMLPLALLAGVPAAGRIRLLSTAEEQRALALRQIALTAPKPLYAREPMLSLPWVSTANQYPAFVLDESFAYLPKLLARAEHPLLRGRVTSRYFASLLLREDDSLYPIAREAGYVLTARPSSHEPVLLIAPSAREK